MTPMEPMASFSLFRADWGYEIMVMYTDPETGARHCINFPLQKEAAVEADNSGFDSPNRAAIEAAIRKDEAQQSRSALKVLLLLFAALVAGSFILDKLGLISHEDCSTDEVWHSGCDGEGAELYRGN